MNQDGKGKEWKEKILETYKSLSLPSTLTSHLKGRCGEMAGGTFYSPASHGICSLE